MEPVIPIFQVLDVFTRRMCECILSLLLLFVFVCIYVCLIGMHHDVATMWFPTLICNSF